MPEIPNSKDLPDFDPSRFESGLNLYQVNVRGKDLESPQVFQDLCTSFGVMLNDQSIDWGGWEYPERMALVAAMNPTSPFHTTVPDRKTVQSNLLFLESIMNYSEGINIYDKLNYQLMTDVYSVLQTNYGDMLRLGDQVELLQNLNYKSNMRRTVDNKAIAFPKGARGCLSKLHCYLIDPVDENALVQFSFYPKRGYDINPLKAHDADAFVFQAPRDDSIFPFLNRDRNSPIKKGFKIPLNILRKVGSDEEVGGARIYSN